MKLPTLEKTMAKFISQAVLFISAMSILTGCVTQSFENDEPVVKTQANRDEMAATRVSLGLGYLKMGNMEEAKRNLEKAKRFSPELVQVHTAFAHYYETVGENDLAEKSFVRSLSIKEDSPDTLNNYGVFLCRQEKVAEAEKQFLKAIAVPSYLLVAKSYENLASCYLQNDNFEKSEMYLKKAIHHSPNNTRILLQMVRLQYAMGGYQNAKRYSQRFERNTQRFTADYLALAYKTYWKLGQRRTAKNYGNMLVKMYPQSWEGKQFVLNGLNFIDADDLARKYAMTQKKQLKGKSSASNKRVVKLSPNRNGNGKHTTSVVTSDTGMVKTDSTATAGKTTIATTQPQGEINTDNVIVSSAKKVEPATITNTASTTNSSSTNDSTASIVGAVASTAGAVNAGASAVTSTAAVVTGVAATAAIASSTDAASNHTEVASSTANENSQVSTNSASDEVPITNGEELAAVNETASTPTADTKASELTTNEQTPNEETVKIVSDVENSPNTTPDSMALNETTTDGASKAALVLASGAAAASVKTDDEPIVVSESNIEENVSADNSDETANNPESSTNTEELFAASTTIEVATADTSEPLSSETLITPTSTQPIAASRDVPLPEALPPEPDPEPEVIEITQEAINESTEEIEDMETVLKSEAYHKVSPGENLYNISVKYNIKLSALRQWNDISESNKIRIGQELYVVNPDVVKIIND